MLLRNQLKHDGISAADRVYISVHDVGHWEGGYYFAGAIPAEWLNSECEHVPGSETYIIRYSDILN